MMFCYVCKDTTIISIRQIILPPPTPVWAPKGGPAGGAKHCSGRRKALHGKNISAALSPKEKIFRKKFFFSLCELISNGFDVAKNAATVSLGLSSGAAMPRKAPRLRRYFALK